MIVTRPPSESAVVMVVVPSLYVATHYPLAQGFVPAALRPHAQQTTRSSSDRDDPQQVVVQGVDLGGQAAESLQMRPARLRRTLVV